MRRVPATIVTGFLGAGKTTLVRHLLRRAEGRRIAVVVNEFGAVGIDRELLLGCGEATCREGDIVELANGCLCCTVADEFLPSLTRLLDRPTPPEHILIETSGLALPKPLLQAFLWPDVRTRVTVDGVLTVIDAAAFAAGRFAEDPAAVARQRAADPAFTHDNPLEEVFSDQLACADLVILNKADLVAADRLAASRRELERKLRPASGRWLPITPPYRPRSRWAWTLRPRTISPRGHAATTWTKRTTTTIFRAWSSSSARSAIPPHFSGGCGRRSPRMTC